MKRPFAALLAGILSIAMLCSISALSVEPAPLSDSALSVESASLSASSPQEYITFEQYLEKYGEETVIEGFKVAEARAMGYDQATLDSLFNPDPEVGKSLFESLSEGEFLGFKVLGVSDTEPDAPNMVIYLDREERVLNNDFFITPTAMEKTDFYEYYYSNSKPDPTALNRAYEPNFGSYFYKYSYSWQGFYQCDTTVTFDNTTLGCGTQDSNMYIFLNAQSDQGTIDFGLMAAPGADNRNKGLYAFWNPSEGDMAVEPYPKVLASSYSIKDKTMTLERKTVTIKLSVGTGQVAMSLESGGSILFYRICNLPGLTFESGKPLTFVQAMSCVEENGKETLPTNGSYFKNVKFSNTILYDTQKSYPFTTMGPYTYFTFLAKPRNISYSYSDSANTQTVSIAYNNPLYALNQPNRDLTTIQTPPPVSREPLNELRAYIADMESIGAHMDEYPSELGTLAVYRTPNPRTGGKYNAIFYRTDGTYIDFYSLLPACWHPYFNPRDIQFSEDGTLLTFISPIEEPDGSMSTIEWGDTLCTVDLTTGKMLSMEPINLSP